jgi:hypothetical protein
MDQPGRRVRPGTGRWIVVLIVIGAIAAIVLVPRALAHRKVLAIGDSLTAQSASVLAADLQAKRFDPEVHAISGSGLLDTKIDWANQTASLVKSFDPDIVVVEFIGDYGLFGTRPGVDLRSPQFYAEWAAAAQQVEDILTSRGAQVYWVLGPPVAQLGGEQEVLEIDHIYQSLRAPNTPSGRPLTIDAVTPFSTPGGGYSEFFPGPGGTPVQVRAPDGTHFTEAGVERFAATIADAIAAGPSRSAWHF